MSPPASQQHDPPIPRSASRGGPLQDSTSATATATTTTSAAAAAAAASVSALSLLSAFSLLTPSHHDRGGPEDSLPPPLPAASQQGVAGDATNLRGAGVAPVDTAARPPAPLPSSSPPNPNDGVGGPSPLHCRTTLLSQVRAILMECRSPPAVAAAPKAPKRPGTAATTTTTTTKVGPKGRSSEYRTNHPRRPSESSPIWGVSAKRTRLDSATPSGTTTEERGMHQGADTHGTVPLLSLRPHESTVSDEAAAAVAVKLPGRCKCSSVSLHDPAMEHVSTLPSPSRTPQSSISSHHNDEDDNDSDKDEVEDENANNDNDNNNHVPHNNHDDEVEVVDDDDDDENDEDDKVSHRNNRIAVHREMPPPVLPPVAASRPPPPARLRYGTSTDQYAYKTVAAGLGRHPRPLLCTSRAAASIATPWKLPARKTSSHMQSPRTARNQEQHSNTLDDEDHSLDRKLPANPSGFSRTPVAGHHEIVDLTLESDDEAQILNLCLVDDSDDDNDVVEVVMVKSCEDAPPKEGRSNEASHLDNSPLGDLALSEKMELVSAATSRADPGSDSSPGWAWDEKAMDEDGPEPIVSGATVVTHVAPLRLRADDTAVVDSDGETEEVVVVQTFDDFERQLVQTPPIQNAVADSLPLDAVPVGDGAPSENLELAAEASARSSPGSTECTSSTGKTGQGSISEPPVSEASLVTQAATTDLERTNSPPPHPATNAEPKAGQRVYARWKENNHWYWGKVQKKYKYSGTKYTVLFDDGDIGRSMEPQDIRTEHDVEQEGAKCSSITVKRTYEDNGSRTGADEPSALSVPPGSSRRGKGVKTNAEPKSKKPKTTMDTAPARKTNDPKPKPQTKSKAESRACGGTKRKAIVASTDTEARKSNDHKPKPQTMCKAESKACGGSKRKACAASTDTEARNCSKLYSVGSRVYARFPDNNQWYWGSITKVLGSGRDATFDILYDDGDTWAGVTHDDLLSEPEYKAWMNAPKGRRKRKKANSGAAVAGAEKISETAPVVPECYPHLTLQELRRRACGECSLCIKPDCGKCEGCVGNLNSTCLHKDVCLFKMCLKISESDKAQPVVDLPDGWKFLVTLPEIVKPSIRSQPVLHDDLRGFCLVSPSGRHFRGVESYFKMKQLTPKEADPMVAEFYDELLGVDLTVPVRKHPLLGLQYLQRWYNCALRPCAVHGVVTACRKSFGECGEILFTVQYHPRSRAMVNGAMGAFDCHVPEVDRHIAERDAWAGCIAADERGVSPLPRGLGRNLAHKPPRWIMPEVMFDDEVDIEGYGPLPRRTLTALGHCIQLQGDLIDLGVYAPLRRGDRKKVIVSVVKNFVYGWKCESYAFDVREHFSDMDRDSDCILDITCDFTGDLHVEARNCIMPYVNETDGKVAASVMAAHDPSGAVHYMLGGLEVEEGCLRFPLRTEVELLVDYGESYERVRCRVGPEYARVKGANYDEFRQSAEGEDAEFAGFVADCSAAEVQDCLVWVEGMWHSKPSPFPVRTRERVLMLALLLRARVLAILQVSSGADVEEVCALGDHVDGEADSGWRELQRDRFPERSKVLVGAVLQEWTDQHESLNAALLRNELSRFVFSRVFQVPETEVARWSIRTLCGKLSTY